MYEPLQALARHHLTALDAEERVVMRLRVAGSSATEIAAHLHLSEAAVRRRLEKVQNSIFVPLSVPRDTWASGFWAAAHLACCLAD